MRLAAALLAALALPAMAADVPASWVGSWQLEATYPKGQLYDTRRELHVYKADGTKIVTGRFYSKSKVVAVYWGIDGNVYWAVCRTKEALEDNGPQPCDQRSEYEVISADARELRYRSPRNGATYTLQRVKDGFKLP